MRAIVCAALVAILPATSGIGAERKEARKTPQRSETLACRLGTEDRHARIAVVLIGGKTDSFAYYSKWKPRTCSVYLQRARDPYSKWADNGNITTVSIEKGAFLIEHRKNGEYHFIFRDVDRERYCGMEGVINGSLTIKKGSEACVLDGDIMVEGTPLGEANVARRIETPEPSQGASDVKQSGLPSSAPAAAPAASAPAVSPAAQPPTQTTAEAARGGDGGNGATTPTPAAVTPASAPATTAASQKPAASTNPFGAFFRSLTTSRPDETPATQP